MNYLPTNQPQYPQNSTQHLPLSSSTEYHSQPLPQYPPQLSNQPPIQSSVQQPPFSNQPPIQSPAQQPPFSNQPPKKKNKNLPWIIALIVVFFIGVGIGHAGNSTDTTPTANTTSNTNAGNSANTQPTATPASTPTPAPKPTPTPAPTWQTTHTYSGNGIKNTETITVPKDWKIQWTCDPTSFYGGQYNVIIEVDNSDGTSADPAAINTMCQSGNTSGETEERVSGNVYLSINSEAAWTITIQELK